jgi:putative aldouronate transport system permease protein
MPAFVATRPVWMEKPNLALRFSKFVILVTIVIVMLFPFVYILSISFAGPQDINGVSVPLIPQHPTLAAYASILAGGVVLRSLEVSIGVTVVGTAVSIAMTTTLAYGLSRTQTVIGSRFVLLLVLGSLLFSPGIIPTYLLVTSLGMENNYAALIVPVMINAFNLVVVRQFFMNIPADLVDAAVMDGCNPLQVFRHIMLPLSKAVIAVIALFYGVALWSDYFNALLYLNNAAMWPIQLVLQLYVLEGQTLATTPIGGHLPPGVSIQMAVIVIATVPIVVVYPFLQKYFTQGVLSGAIKG